MIQTFVGFRLTLGDLPMRTYAIRQKLSAEEVSSLVFRLAPNSVDPGLEIDALETKILSPYIQRVGTC